MEKLAKLAERAKKQIERLDRLSKNIKLAESHMKVCCTEFSFLFICKSIAIKDGLFIKHDCLLWHPQDQNRIIYIQYETPNEPNAFDMKKVIFDRPYHDIPVEIRLEYEHCFEQFIDEITRLVSNEKKGEFIGNAKDNDPILSASLLRFEDELPFVDI